MASLPILQTDLPQEQERYHRTLIATMVNELIKVRPPFDRTEAEVSAGVTPVDYKYPPGDVRRYGVTGDGSADDTMAFEDCLLSCSGAPYSMYVPPAPVKYKVDPLTIPSDIDIYVDGQAIIEANTGFAAADVLFDFSGADNVTMDCNGAIFRMLKSEYTTGEQRHLFYLFGCTNVLLRNPRALDSGGDGYYVNGAIGLTLENPVADNNRRQGMSVIGATNMRVPGVARFLNTNGTAPQDGLDFEPNSDQDELIDIQFETVYCENNSGNAVTFYLDDYKTGAPSDVSVSIGKIISRGNTQALRVRNCYVDGSLSSSYGGFISIGEVVADGDSSNTLFVEDKSLSGPLLTVGRVTANNPCTGSSAFADTAAVYIHDTSATVTGGIHIGQVSAKATHTDMDYGVILECGAGFTDLRVEIENIRGYQVAPVRWNNTTSTIAEATTGIVDTSKLTDTVALTSGTNIVATAHVGRVITNAGAVGSVTMALREYLPRENPYRFRVEAAQTISIDTFDAADRIVGTTAAGQTVTSNVVGAECAVYFLGTFGGVRYWRLQPLGNPASWTFN